MEEVQKRHRGEQRELQGRITQKKKNATKKTRKNVNDECAELERAMKERQQIEIDALAGEAPERPVKPLEDEDRTSVLSNAPLSSEACGQGTLQQHFQDLNVTSGSEATSHPRKQNRQKARLARRAAEQEAVAAQAAKEATDMPDQRAVEKEIMMGKIEARGLVEQNIRSDGHCLYAAVGDQLQQSGRSLGGDGIPAYKVVRRDAAAFIEEHPDDFAPFLEEPLGEYVAKVRDTGEWGGQLELSALARAYKLDISVLQGDGRVERIEHGGQDATEIWLAYYRHSLGLGEHYNSLHRKP